jgi:hypothetical protein
VTTSRIVDDKSQRKFLDCKQIFYKNIFELIDVRHCFYYFLVVSNSIDVINVLVVQSNKTKNIRLSFVCLSHAHVRFNKQLDRKTKLLSYMNIFFEVAMKSKRKTQKFLQAHETISNEICDTYVE